MRLYLVALLFCISFLHVAARSFGQNISLDFKDASLVQVFSEIKKQSGYSFFYKLSELKDSKSVNIHLKNVPFEMALKAVFKDQPLVFEIVDQTIAVHSKVISVMSQATNTIQENQAVTITGTVNDQNGKPLNGASVRIKGTSRVVVTEQNGSFRLNQVSQDAILQISFVGYQSKEVTIAGSTTLSIVLSNISSELDDVQIVAYGTTTRRMSTGNISTVKSEQIANQPINNPILSLQGRIPGIMIEQSNGISGANIKVRVQGINSISNGNNPYYVIDGVPYNSDNFSNPAVPVMSSVLDGGSPLAMLNPAIIESIEVLKDADATAIYGSRAANGAILITTKKGKAGQTKIDLTAQQGWGKISKKIKLMNTQQYLNLRKEAYFINDKLTGTSPAYVTAYDINGTWDSTKSTDWQKELIGGTSLYKDYQGTLSGGNNSTQFLFGANFHSETTVFPGDLADRKVSVQMNLNHRSSNNRFRFQFSGNYLDDYNNLSGYDLTTPAVQLAPNAPSLYLPNGNLNWDTLPNGKSTWSNPLTYLLRSYKVKTTNLIANSIISYQILPGLDIKSSFGYNRLQNDELLKVPITYYAPESRLTAKRNRQDLTKSVINWIVEPQIVYKKNIGRNTIDGLLGATFQSTKNGLLGISTSGYVTDGQIDNIQSAPTMNVNNVLNTEYRYNAAFGRLGFTYDQKYILNVTGRKDGTSRFGAENRFHFFYSIGGGWIFSEEKFIQSNVPFLSFGKIRASYGTTGSDQVGDYSYLNLYSSTSAGVPYQGATGLMPTGLTNPYLQWEQTNKFNVGLDLGIIKNRILLNANFYRNITGNQLLPASLPSVAGFTSINQNLPAKVLNQGVELTLDFQPIISKVLKWSGNINMTIPSNKLLEFPNLSSNSTYKNSLVIGQSINMTKAYHYMGINAETGLYQFLGSNGNLTSQPSSLTDRTQYINLLPKFFGGFQNTFILGDFQLNFLFQYVNQKARDYRFGSAPGTLRNQPLTVIDRWRDKDNLGTIQKATTSASNPSLSAFSSSDGGIIDASFLKLKNVNLSWTLPSSWKDRLKFQSMRIFILAQNLWTITKYQGDPETKIFTSLPTLKMFTIGLQLSL